MAESRDHATEDEGNCSDALPNARASAGTTEDGAEGGSAFAHQAVCLALFPARGDLRGFRADCGRDAGFVRSGLPGVALRQLAEADSRRICFLYFGGALLLYRVEMGHERLAGALGGDVRDRGDRGFGIG